MMEADFGMTQQAMREHDRHIGDENLYVSFFMHPLQNKAKSLEEGRPIFVDTEYVRIMVPGDKGNIIMREVRDTDRQRFSKQYQAFKNDEAEIVEGTPLDKWNLISQAQVEELKYFGIRTVENLANVTDTNAQKFMGINLLRDKARQYIEAASAEAPIAQLQDELSQRDSVISEQAELIANMQERLSALEEDKPKKKGK
jgi:hypothetical protein